MTYRLEIVARTASIVTGRLLDLAALTKKVCRLEALSATPIESLSNDLGGLGADGLPIVPLA
jgi:hypothetical protein